MAKGQLQLRHFNELTDSLSDKSQVPHYRYSILLLGSTDRTTSVHGVF